MINYENILLVKIDMENQLRETKDLLKTTRIDMEKLIIKNEIYDRCLKTVDMLDLWKRKIVWNNDSIKRYDSNIAEYIDTIKEFEIELNILETIIAENHK
ncbi:MAG: hypothetical protein QM644_16250 [Mobilitalea sp.]